MWSRGDRGKVSTDYLSYNIGQGLHSIQHFSSSCANYQMFERNIMWLSVKADIQGLSRLREMLNDVSVKYI